MMETTSIDHMSHLPPSTPVACIVNTSVNDEVVSFFILDLFPSYTDAPRVP